MEMFLSGDVSNVFEYDVIPLLKKRNRAQVETKAKTKKVLLTSNRQVWQQGYVKVKTKHRSKRKANSKVISKIFLLMFRRKVLSQEASRIRIWKGQTSPLEQTSRVESFHYVLCLWVPKLLAFSYPRHEVQACLYIYMFFLSWWLILLFFFFSAL